MILLFRLLTRLIVLLLAYVAALMAAVTTLMASIIGWRAAFGGLAPATPEAEMIHLFFSGAFGLIALFSIGSAALAPSAFAALIIEAFSWRSVYTHIVAGGVIALLVLTANHAYDGPPPQQDSIIALASGFVGGFVYWLIAGRSTGYWRTKALSARLGEEELQRESAKDAGKNIIDQTGNPR